MTLRLRTAARSDVGLVRPGNEDSGFAGQRLLIVADGMGGHAAGELASATAVATLASIEQNPPADPQILGALADAVDEVGDQIARTIHAEPEFTGMGTTVTGIYWMGERIAILHVGDSRGYLLRDGELTPLTHDHTLVQTLVDAGEITEAEAAVHPKRSMILRALDGINPVEPDLSVREARTGDRLLLCSDGLTGVVPNDELAIALAQGDPTGCVTRLVDLALERGAPDNVTVVVADIVDLADEDAGDEANEEPVVVGAAGEPRVRARLPHVRFPQDAQPDPDRPDAPPPVAGPPTAEHRAITAALADDSALRATPKRPSRGRRIAVVVGSVAAALLLLVAGAFIVVRGWLSSQWYVAVNGSPGTGTVAVFNGVQGSFLGISLSTIVRDTDTTVGTLPLFDQELVSKGIPAASELDANRIVSELQIRAAECQTITPPVGCPGVAS